MFHRYQNQRFTGPFGDQDVQNCPVTADAIAMAALEERALAEALETNSQLVRETAARRLSALRMARLQADERIVLDNEQERFEGSARYVEHRLAGDDIRFAYHRGNYSAELFGDPDFLMKAGFRDPRLSRPLIASAQQERQFFRHSIGLVSATSTSPFRTASPGPNS